MSGSLRHIDRSQFVPFCPDRAFGFFADASNLEAITPHWLRFQIVTPLPMVMGEGALIDYRLRLHWAPVRWRTRIERWEPPRCFVDRQISGPFALWQHTHTFEERPGGTLIRDRVEYRMPLGPVGKLAHGLLIGRDLERIFDYRRTAITELLGGGHELRRVGDAVVSSAGAARCG